jgi:hypothetical protein
LTPKMDGDEHDVCTFPSRQRYTYSGLLGLSGAYSLPVNLIISIGPQTSTHPDVCGIEMTAFLVILVFFVIASSTVHMYSCSCVHFQLRHTSFASWKMSKSDPSKNDGILQMKTKE